MSPIIYIASYPRSGNTFFRKVLLDCFGHQSYSIYDEPGLLGGYVGDARLSNDEGPVFVKNHDMSPAWDIRRRVIYIVRDGRDALVSHARFIEAQDDKGAPYYEILKKLIEGRMPSPHAGEYWQHWGKHVTAYHNRLANMAVIHFEDLIQEPVNIVGKAIKAVGVDTYANSVAPPKFEEMRDWMPGLHRRGEVGSYKDEMTDALHELFWEYHGEGMAKAGYHKENAMQEAMV